MSYTTAASKQFQLFFLHVIRGTCMHKQAVLYGSKNMYTHASALVLQLVTSNNLTIAIEA